MLHSPLYANKDSCSKLLSNMDQHDLNVIPNDLVDKFEPKSRWFIKYKRLLIPATLLIAAVIILLVINSGNTPAKKVSTNTKPTTPNPVSVWKTSNGGSITNLKNDIASVNKQIAIQSYVGQESACQQLGTDANSASTLPSIPNPTAESELTSGTSELKQAAMLCVSGTQIYLNIADNYKPTVELQAVNDMNSFTTYFQQGTSQIQALTNSLESLSN
jgi:hypothetical protein